MLDETGKKAGKKGKLCGMVADVGLAWKGAGIRISSLVLSVLFVLLDWDWYWYSSGRGFSRPTVEGSPYICLAIQRVYPTRQPYVTPYTNTAWVASPQKHHVFHRSSAPFCLYCKMSSIETRPRLLTVHLYPLSTATGHRSDPTTQPLILSIFSQVD